MYARQSVNWLNILRQGSRATARTATAFALAVALAVFGVPTSNAAAPKPSTISVNTTNEAEEDGLCSLREAVLAANTNQQVDGCEAGGLTDVISVPAGEYTVTQGALVLESSTVLRGYGAVVRRPVAQPEPYWRDAIVLIAPTADAEIAGVTINGSGGLCPGLVNEGDLLMIDGSVTGTNWHVPAACLQGGGGAFSNRGTATLLRTSITNNRAELAASAFNNSGTLRIVEGVISGNSSIPFQRFGTPFISANRGDLSLEGTTYRENGPSSLLNSGRLTVRNSSFQGLGGFGTGLGNEGDALVVRSSITGSANGIRNSGVASGRLLRHRGQHKFWLRVRPISGRNR